MKVINTRLCGLLVMAVIAILTVLPGCGQTGSTHTEAPTPVAPSTHSTTPASSRAFSPIKTPSTTLFELPKYTLTNLKQAQTDTSWEISGTIEQREPKWQGLKIGERFYGVTTSPDRGTNLVPHAGGIVIVFCNREGRDIAWLGTDTSYVKKEIDTWSFVLRMSSDGNLPDYTYLYHPSMGDYLSFGAFQKEAQISQILVSLDDDEESVQYDNNQYMRQFEVDLSNSPGYQPLSISTPTLSKIPPKFIVTKIAISRSKSLTITGELKQIELAWQGLPESEAIRVGSVSVWFCKPDGSPIIDYHGSELMGFAADTLKPEVIIDQGTFSIQLSEGKYGQNFREGAFKNMSFSEFIRTAVISKMLVSTNRVQSVSDYMAQFEADLSDAIVEDNTIQ